MNINSCQIGNMHSGKDIVVKPPVWERAASTFRKLLSVYVFSYFPFGFEGRIWDLIVSVPDHCLSFYSDDYGNK